MSSAASRFVSERDLDAARTENRRSVLERLGAKESSGAEDHRPLYERLQEQRRDQEARRAESGHYGAVYPFHRRTERNLGSHS